MTKLIERTRQSKNCYCLAEAYIGGAPTGENQERTMRNFLFFLASAHLMMVGIAQAQMYLPPVNPGAGPSYTAPSYTAPRVYAPPPGVALLAPPPARRSLAICGANSALEKTGATIPGANSVPTKMREPTAGDKNAQRKIGSSARKSKRKNYRTIPQRRDISVDVRQVRRRPLVRVTRPVQTPLVRQPLLVRLTLARRVLPRRASW